MKRVLTRIIAVVLVLTSVYLPGQSMIADALPKDNITNIQENINQRSNIKTGKINPCDYLNIRSGPGANNKVVGKVYSNNEVTILETNSNGWHKIKTSNGVVGWASGTYITIKNNTSNASANQNSNKVNKLIEVANKQLGKPYAWGANGPNSFDCSGLTYYVYKNALGVNLPRTSREQSKVGTKVDKKNLKAGDLVFFNTGGSGISHVGMYVGNNNFIHSTQPGDTVKIHSINSSYYSRTFVTARRVVN